MQRVKVGDLVRHVNDPEFWLGHGVVLRIYPVLDEVLVRWFDNWADSDPLDIETIRTLEVFSES
jgi:hypothetical protein